MRTILRKGGYSAETAATYVDNSKSVYSLSTELEPQYKWENNKPIEEITGYKAWFSQEEQEPFEVKFASKVKLPNYLAKVELEGLEACEVRNKVYFRATGLEEVK